VEVEVEVEVEAYLVSRRVTIVSSRAAPVIASVFVDTAVLFRKDRVIILVARSVDEYVLMVEGLHRYR